MKVERDIETSGTQPARELKIVSPAGQAPRALGDDDVVELGMMTNHGCGGSLDEVREMRVGKPAPQRANRGSGEHHVAD